MCVYPAKLVLGSVGVVRTNASFHKGTHKAYRDLRCPHSFFVHCNVNHFLEVCPVCDVFFSCFSFSYT